MKRERIAEGIYVYTSKQHRFGTDAYLLTRFSRYREKDIVCEFGTGCGIIPLLMQVHRPPRLVYALDIQPSAIEQLQRGIAESGSPSIIPLCCDLRMLWEGYPREDVDLVLCNPPYFPEGSGKASQNEEQNIARHGVCCRPIDIAEGAKCLLKYGGRFCICGKPTYLTEYMITMQACGIEPKRLQFVHKNAHSAPWLFLLEGKRGGKSGLSILAPFLMYENGRLTPEAASLSE